MINFLIALSFFAFLHPHQDAYSRMVDRVQGSIIRITGFMADDGDGHDYVCTGFVYRPETVLTAAHCLGTNMLGDGQPVVLERVSPQLDLAVLRLATKKPSLEFRAEDVQRFEEVSAIGYGFSWDVLTVIKQRVFLRNYPGSGMAPGTFAQGETIGGMSGGPVIDSKGRVVGIIQRGNAGVSYGVSISLIQQFIQ